MTDEQIATLYIGDWSSHCGACGGNASPSDTHHLRGGPHSNAWTNADSTLDQRNGCGAKFVDVAPEMGSRVTSSMLAEDRPDLPIAPRGRYTA